MTALSVAVARLRSSRAEELAGAQVRRELAILKPTSDELDRHATPEPDLVARQIGVRWAHKQASYFELKMLAESDDPTLGDEIIEAIREAWSEIQAALSEAEPHEPTPADPFQETEE